MGKLFVIDGTDGSGKQTQMQELKNKLISDRIEFKEVSFPNYDSPSSSLVKMYLSGEFGDNANSFPIMNGILHEYGKTVMDEISFSNAVKLFL